jgi:hypothetical protein
MRRKAGADIGQAKALTQFVAATRPPKGTRFDSPFGKICDACFNTAHAACEWGDCACPCRTRVELESPPEPKPDTLGLALEGVAWERKSEDEG